MIPTKAAGVLLAPIVIKINPKPSWINPARNPKNISYEEISIFEDIKKPTIIAIDPAINCKGTISTSGYFLTIKIKNAKEIGIINAIKLPDNCPGDKELPTIKIIPINAIIIESNVILEIFSFKKT